MLVGGKRDRGGRHRNLFVEVDRHHQGQSGAFLSHGLLGVRGRTTIITKHKHRAFSSLDLAQRKFAIDSLAYDNYRFSSLPPYLALHLALVPTLYDRLPSSET